MMWSIDYSDSSSSDDDSVENTLETSGSVNIAAAKDSASTKPKTNFSEKFNELKKRRLGLNSSISASSGQEPPTNEIQISKKKRSDKRNAKRTRNDLYRDLNKYMPIAFELKERNDVFKKTKIEEELDEVIKEKDFQSAVRLSDEIVKRKFATQVKSAIDAQKYAKSKLEQEQRKQKKKRKKLKWSFDQKERWETKGNM